MRKNLIRKIPLLAAFFCSLIGAQAGTVWSFATIPASANIAGPAGSTVGWGYSITNPDASQWLVLSSVSADPFVQAMPLSIFDFPIVAPGITVSQPYNGASGLYQLTWNPGAAPGTTNSGTFVLSAEWWDGNPLAGGIFL